MVAFLVALLCVLLALATPLHAQINVQTRITTSASLRTMLTDETGTAFAVFADAPTFTGIPLFSGGLKITGTPVNGIEIAAGAGSAYAIKSLATTPSYITGHVRVGIDSSLGVFTLYSGDTSVTSSIYALSQLFSAGSNVLASYNEGSSYHASGTIGYVRGLTGTATHYGSAGDVTNMMGIWAEVFHTGGGTTNSLSAFYAAAIGCAGGTCTNVHGLYLEAQTAGVNKYQIYSAGTALSHFAGPIQVDAPATQTIAAGNTIASDACASVKRITSGGAVTTSTANTITAPAAANSGCQMAVCNVGANTITLDKNANILLVGGADVVLAANSCLMVGSDGVIWRQLSAQLTAT